MIEFDKWDKSLCRLDCPLKDKLVLGDSCIGCIAARESGWKHALEWVQEMFHINKFNPPPILNIQEEIREELND